VAFGYKTAMKRHRLILASVLTSAALVATGPASAQDKGSVNPKPLPPLANPNDPSTPAKELFGRKPQPAAMPPSPIGFYAHGCIAGAVPLPINGPAWQVMRLSRNRNWGHPDLIALLQRVATKAQKTAGWPGLLVGDMSQPRGGPMLTGHASHQIGLDADVWLTPMPNRQLSREEREETSAVMMVRKDRLDIDPHTWTPTHLPVIRAAAQEPQVERIFVNAAIKKALCREAKGDRGWLSKVRPMYGHDYHFHIRMKCPAGSTSCESQPPPNEGEGCSAGDLAFWFSDAVLHPKPPPTPPKPKPPLTMANLPAECRQVLQAP
jgi:penicillin-insensitive murein endopeptidase